MSDLIDLLETDFFRVGLRVGLITLVAGWLVTLVFRRRVRPLPINGLLMAAGTIYALHMLGVDLSGELTGLALIAVGAFLAHLLRAPEWAVPIAVVPGAAWLAISTTTTGLTWVHAILLVFVPVGGYLISDFERRYDDLGLGVIFYGLAALGVFVAVPDTEWARTLIAVVVPLTLLAWPRPSVSLGVEGGYLAVAVLILVTGQGGGPRPASIVGGIACLGLLLIEPVAMAVRPAIVALTTWFERNWAGAVIASLPQFAVVALCSRVAARFTRELPALLIVAVVYGLTAAVGVSASSNEAIKERAS